MKKNIALYFRYVSVVLRCTMQYKASFFMSVIGRFLVSVSSLLGIYFLFSGFTEIKGYSYGDVLLCLSIMQMAFATAECIASGFAKISGIIKRGEFDRILLRPRSPILQIMGGNFDLGRIGLLATGALVLAIGIQESNVSWNLARGAVLVFMVAGGAMLFTGLFMIGAAICFFSIEETKCMNMFTYGGSEHGKYPIDIYGKKMMMFCTCVIPYTLVQYYPLQYILGRTENWWYGLYPFGTAFFLSVCYVFWRFGMRHYKSCGS